MRDFNGYGDSGLKPTSTAEPAVPTIAPHRQIMQAWHALPRSERRRITGWLAWIVATTAAFAQPLVELVRYAGENDLISHAPLVPFVTGYLLFIKREKLTGAGPSSWIGSLLMIALGVAAIGAAVFNAAALSANDRLTMTTLAYVSLVIAGGFLFMGATWMTRAAFPMTFLVFMIPLPDIAVAALEHASMLASADVAAWMLRASGTPLIRDGTVFTLPTIVLEVARECSGIRSSLVLFITSLVASHMFLTSRWRRIVLVAFVIPLGIVRNGFRILVISLLCVHVGPHMIDSFIHHRGGPIFFVLSLGPLFLLLSWLRRRDNQA
jgi:exosortase C (VPDSG-CTERM-specific)